MKRRQRSKDFVSSLAGSVSIYFIAATAGIVLLCALLIDFSRIAAFRYTAMTAVQSGVRSVLSSYDPVFYDKYGLFIRGGEEADLLLRTALEGDAADPATEPGDVFSYLHAEWTDTGVTESRPLADHEVFRRQVLEEMKYKAPVDVALELAGKFRGVKPAMREAAATVDMLERLRKAYERREAALDDAIAEQERAGDQTVTLLRRLAPYPAVPLSGRLPAGAATHAADAALRYADYAAVRQSLALSGDETDPLLLQQWAAAVNAFELSVSGLSTALSDAAARMDAAAERSREKAAEALRRAQAANEEMKAIAEEAEESAVAEEADASASSSGSESEAGLDESVDSQTVSALGEIRRTARELILEDGFFDGYASELEAQWGKTTGLAREAAGTASDLSGSLGASGQGDKLLASAGRLQGGLQQFAAAYAAGGTVLQERRAAFGRHRAQDAERKSLEKQADAEWTGWKKQIGGLRGRESAEDAQTSFQEADRLARDNLAWNREQDAVPEGRAEPGDASEGRDSAMESANASMSALEEAGVRLRDSVYVSEYAFGRLSRFPPDQAKRLIAGEAVPVALDRQEMEYVMYGLADPYGNIAAAYGEIFAFRLAVRTMEGLIECRSMGHPLLILAAALVYGVRNALLDIRMLLDRDSVPLSKYLKVETSYADYLRLFFILHTDSPARLSRCIAVMEHATGLSLSRAYTYAEAEATASLRLWFFPGLQKHLGRFARLGGTVKGNRYEAVYAADSAYQ